jgi:hypothetical protein
LSIFTRPLISVGVAVAVFVQGADILKNVGHLVDGVVAALRRGAVAADALDVHPDLHAAPVAAVDAAVGGLGGDDELRRHLVLVMDVLPAQAVAVLLLHGAGDQILYILGDEVPDPS